MPTFGGYPSLSGNRKTDHAEMLNRSIQPLNTVLVMTLVRGQTCSKGVHNHTVREAADEEGPAPSGNGMA